MNIIKIDNPLIRSMSSPVDFNDTELVKDLIYSLSSSFNPRLLGLAAIQVGYQKRVFVLREDFNALYSDTDTIPIKFFFNPEIIHKGTDLVTSVEGCASVPLIHEGVVRSSVVVIRAQNENGEEFTHSTSKLEACVVQHEIDHLNGILFVDYLNREKRRKVCRLCGIKSLGRPDVGI